MKSILRFQQMIFKPVHGFHERSFKINVVHLSQNDYGP